MGIRIKRKGSDCEVEGCKGVVRIKGLCGKHGMALRRYGNVLGGKINRESICKGCGDSFILKKSNQEYCNSPCYRKSLQGRAAAYQATKDYRTRNNEKLNARSIFRRRPLQKTDNCLVCNTKENLHRHHHNYKNRLDVTILCKNHHLELHDWDSN